jgi:hypothetical protein
MARYRKKPVEVEAILVKDALKAARGDWRGLPTWLREAYEGGRVLFLYDAVEIATLEGRMRGGQSDWVVRGVKGELYPVKADIFEATYEVAQ